MQKYFILSLISFAFCIFTVFFVISLTPKTPTPISKVDTNIPAPDSLFDKGEALFKQHCTSCHKIDAKLVGPKLQGVTKKYADDPKWLYAFIKNSQKLIKRGDKKALKIYEEYGKVGMNAFPFFTDEDIRAILYYVENWYPMPQPTKTACY
jgi:cytochrome c551/c552